MLEGVGLEKAQREEEVLAGIPLHRRPDASRSSHQNRVARMLAPP